VSPAVWHGLITSGIAATTLAACATPAGEPPAQAPRRYNGIGQVLMAMTPKFALCERCGVPTPKTLAAVPLAEASITTAASHLTPETAARPVVPVAASASGPQPAGNSSQRAQISFGFASAALSNDARRQLAGLLPQLRRAASVAIVGYTDDQGGQRINDSLAEARAVNVMLYLRDALGDASKTVLSANGKGRCCYVDSGSTDRARAVNRRVELLIRTDSTPGAADAGASSSVSRKPS
jgi:outer membrane protein OmpA-like peptidoglycan-associated protein